MVTGASFPPIWVGVNNCVAVSFGTMAKASWTVWKEKDRYEIWETDLSQHGWGGTKSFAETWVYRALLEQQSRCVRITKTDRNDCHRHRWDMEVSGEISQRNMEDRICAQEQMR
jgi:hypothetical protein